MLQFTFAVFYHTTQNICVFRMYLITQVFGSIGKLLADDGTTPLGSQGTDADTDASAERAAAFWRDLLGSILPALLADELPLVRVAACDCSSMIGERPYMALPLEVQLTHRLCLTFFLTVFKTIISRFFMGNKNALDIQLSFCCC